MELKIKCDQQMKTTCKYKKYKEKTGSKQKMQNYCIFVDKGISVISRFVDNLYNSLGLGFICILLALK